MLRIAHNISALNTYNQLNRNSRASSKTMEKLSSGLRINRAADDAAGLAISQKMRAQIRGLAQAERNIQDGISLIQTAESGLGDIQSNIQRMNELVLQAANGTLTSSDRQQIQKEIEQIKQSIDSIANNTTFNGIHLLNVSDAPPTGYSVVNLANAASITIFEKSGSHTYEATFSIADLVGGVNWATPATPPVSPEPYQFSVDLENNTFTTRAETGGYGNNITAVRVNGLQGYEETEVYATKLISYSGTPWDDHPPENILGDDLSDWPNFEDYGDVWTEITVQFEANIDPDTYPVPDPSSNEVILQVGPNSGDTFTVELTDARTTALGLADVAVDPPSKALEALDNIQNAINTVSSERAKFGADQNALEHIHKNVSNYGENLSAAESRIADADMAKEVMHLTRNQILTQASQAMLAQANASLQHVLSLLP